MTKHIMPYVCLICCVFLQHTLETALLSASQEIEMGSDNPAAIQSVIQQRDLLQSGLLSTCRELSRVTAVSHTAYSHIHCTLSCWTLMLPFSRSTIRILASSLSFTKWIFSKPGTGAVVEGV